MNLTVTTLVENSLGENTELNTEHGLSFYIVTDTMRCLFDTGATGLFLKNAHTLGVPTDQVTHLFMSHGHYDHSGGYLPWLSQRGDTPTELFVKPGFFHKKYSKNFLGGLRYNGNAFTRADILNRGVTIHEIEETVSEVFPGIYSVSGFSRECDFEPINPKFVVEKKDGTFGVDDFSDEQVLVLKSDQGLVVLIGCAHPGVVNILETVRAHFDEPIHTVIGGTHLVEADETRIEKTTDYLLKAKIPRVMFCHCSGSPEHLHTLIARLGETYQTNPTGTTVRF